MRPSSPQPSYEQARAIDLYRARAGYFWKRTLAEKWRDGTDADEPDGHLLRQVRNQFGPLWLARQ